MREIYVSTRKNFDISTTFLNSRNVKYVSKLTKNTSNKSLRPTESEIDFEKTFGQTHGKQTNSELEIWKFQGFGEKYEFL